ncbi:MAG: hypothetical protein WCA35_02150 [Kovacikia sp.]|jgi:hypothetical protein
MTITELKRKGFQALVDALGYADAIRFLRQYDSGQGDYTQERHQWLDPLTLDDFKSYVKRKRGQETSKEG